MSNDPRSRRPVIRKDWPKHWLLTKAEAKALLATENWTIDPETYYWDAYVSDKGELLFIKDRGRSQLYESRQALRDAYAENRADTRRSHHCLEGQIPQGPHFIEAVPALIDELAVFLKLPREKLDGTYESLEAVDAALKKVRPKRRILETPNFFAAIIAYTGEVMRKAVNGVWWLRPAEDGVYEPHVLLEEGKFKDDLNPFVYTYDMITEAGPISLAVVVSVQVDHVSRARDLATRR